MKCYQSFDSHDTQMVSSTAKSIFGVNVGSRTLHISMSVNRPNKIYTGFSRALSNVHIINHHLQDVFKSSQMVYLLRNEISVSTHDFQHITKNCQTQYSLGRVENNAEEIKNYSDGIKMSDWCGFTSCTR